MASAPDYSPRRTNRAEAMAKAGHAAGIGIGKSLRLAHMAFNRALRMELAKHGVTFAQFVHLEQLWNEDGLTQAELSRRIGVETATSTPIIDQLEQQGLIERRRNTSDRRKINVQLMKKGAVLRTVLFAAARRVNKVARSRLSSDDLAILTAILSRMTDTINAEYPGSNSVDARTRLGS